MDRAHAPNKWFAVNWNYSPIGKDALECFDRSLIILVTKNGSQDHVIGDIKIDVARGQPIEIACVGAGSAYDARHRQR